MQGAQGVVFLAAAQAVTATRLCYSRRPDKLVVTATGLDELVALGSLPVRAARFLEAAVASGLNVIVAGGRRPERRPC